MSPWELEACVEGWNAAHGAEQKPPPMSDARFDQLRAERGYA
jgi:hypothetical protein